MNVADLCMVICDMAGHRCSLSVAFSIVILRLRAIAGLLVMLNSLVFVQPLHAYEADQYSNRLLDVEDALETMDQFVNAHLQAIIDEWQGQRDEIRFAREVYRQLGSWYWVDKIERWVMNSDTISRYPHRKYRSIYRGMPIWATRVNFLFGVGAANRLAGVQVGSDKFGHFFSQGLKYYLREKRGWDMTRIIDRGAFAERWIFGQLTTGVYSNADLVANYEGYLFYRNLSEVHPLSGKRALIGWNGSTPFLQRDFTWRDHVNDYWDEALNPSFLSGLLQRHMVPAIRLLCDDYRIRPDAFIPRDDEMLWQRYRHVGLKDARYNRLDRVCEPLLAD